NDTTDPEAILAFQTSTVITPYVDLVTPNPDKIIDGQTVGPADPIRIELVDGSATTVNAGTIALSLNGASAAPTTTKSGNRTTLLVSHAFPNLLPAGSTNTLTLVYSDTATPANVYSNSWSFVVSKYVTIPAGIGSPIGSGDTTKPGFRIKTEQLDIFSPTVGTAGANQAQNLVAFAEQELLGLFGTNVADLTLADANGYFHETGVINYDKDAANDGQQGNFGGETQVPGIPGNTQYSLNTENYALEIQTYAEFPTAGLYTLGVSSDDGFAVTVATAPGPLLALNIGAPAAIAGRMGAVSGGTDEGGISKPLTGVSVTGKLVYANPPLADAPLQNAAAIAGNIALIDRGVVAYSAKLQAALDAGAIGVVIVNNRDTNSPDGILPVVMGGTPVNIPAVMVGLYDGQKLKDHLADAGGVSVTIGGDTTLRLGDFNGGRGADAGTLFSFVVPTPGVYPLRNVTFQGGGGGNVEWFSVAADGTKILLNDTATAGAIKTYQAVTTVALPTVSVTSNGTEIVLTFTGTLQSSDTVNGAYAPVAGATSPLHVPFSVGAAKFYRASN
ncbi:MAG TPA: PA domain-containing protein, partial [Candidatus Limnocylindria bacterium]|nr:PA domain-containing protein [Candidatus Limnocylindria bacterium]